MSPTTNGNSAETILAITGLRTQFGPQIIHDDLQLTIQRGEIIGIVGGSGTGKSVLLRTMVGLIHPAAGQITVLGQDITKMKNTARAALQKRIGVLFQDGAVQLAHGGAKHHAAARRAHRPASSAAPRNCRG